MSPLSPLSMPRQLGTCAVVALATAGLLACGNTDHRQVSGPASRQVVSDRAALPVRHELAVAESAVAYDQAVGKTQASVVLAPHRHAPQLLDHTPVQQDRERYADSTPNAVKRVHDEPVSTFSIDVDTGSYANVRRMLQQGVLPPGDAVRIEEMVNYFDYAYPAPDAGDTPFSVTTTLAPAPWNDQAELLRIGIHGHDIPDDESRQANLVFLVDVSGSMASPNKLGLLSSSLSLLARGLDADDRVSIVTYAGAAGVVLDSAAGNDLAAIDGALANLTAGGSTAGSAGIETAYRLAEKNKGENTVNRIILATDGDFNVGLSSVEALLSMIEKRRDSGIALTTLGFGAGNYNDELMEQLADAGNGNHAYIDTLSEARKVLSQQLEGTLFTIARDVKIQLEFNPAVVSEYRLVGYDNRLLAEEDFANDKIDAGEIGAGHTVTALYEITRVGKQGHLPERRYSQEDSVGGTSLSAEFGELRLRYKSPAALDVSDPSKLMTVTLAADAGFASLAEADTDFRFATAVAAWGELLRDDKYLGEFSYADVSDLARQARGDDIYGYRSAFLGLVDLAAALDDRARLSHSTIGKNPQEGPDRG